MTDSNAQWKYYSDGFDASNRLWHFIHELQADGGDVHAPSGLLHEGVIQFGAWLEAHPGVSEQEHRRAAIDIIRPYINTRA